MKQHEQPNARLLDGNGASHVNSSISFAIQAQKEIPPKKTAVRLARCKGRIPQFKKEHREFYTATFATFSRAYRSFEPPSCGRWAAANPIRQKTRALELIFTAENSFIGSETWLLPDGDRRANGSEALWREKGPAPVTSPRWGTYLAINWQRTDVNVLFTSKDRRFPTPQVTTTHLFPPNQRRNASLLLRNWQPNSDLAGQQRRGEDPPGGRVVEVVGPNSKFRMATRKILRVENDLSQLP